MFPPKTQLKTIASAVLGPLTLFIATAVTGPGTLRAQAVSWTEVGYSSAPSARCGMGMVYDGATNSTLLFGGAIWGPGRYTLRLWATECVRGSYSV